MAGFAVDCRGDATPKKYLLDEIAGGLAAAPVPKEGLAGIRFACRGDAPTPLLAFRRCRRHPGDQAYLRQRSFNDVAQLFQGFRERRGRGTRRAYVPALNGGERLEGYIHQSALLLRQCTKPGVQVRCLIEERVLPLIPECRYCVGNGFIETAVERAELVCRNGCVFLDGQVRNGLANVTIVMHDLVDRVSEAKELCAVPGGRATDVRVHG